MSRRELDLHIALLTALMLGIAEFTGAKNMIAQTVQYTVLELSDAANGGELASALDNLGDVVGRADNLGRPETRFGVANYDVLQAKLLRGGEAL